MCFLRTFFIILSTWVLLSLLEISIQVHFIAWAFLSASILACPASASHFLRVENGVGDDLCDGFLLGNGVATLVMSCSIGEEWVVRGKSPGRWSRPIRFRQTLISTPLRCARFINFEHGQGANGLNSIRYDEFYEARGHLTHHRHGCPPRRRAGEKDQEKVGQEVWKELERILFSDGRRAENSNRRQE